MAKRVRMRAEPSGPSEIPNPDALLHEAPNVLEFYTNEPEEEVPESLPDEPPLTNDELVTIRWVIFGKCPRCGAIVRAWKAPAFNPEVFAELQAQKIDPVSGHYSSCDEKWRAN